MRYGSREDFAAAMAFLDASDAQRQAQQAAARDQQRRQLRRARRLAALFGLVAAALIATFVAYQYLYAWDYVAHFNDFAKVWGEPRGIGRLTSGQVRHRYVSLRIVRSGRWGRVRRMEAVNRRGALTPRHGIGTYLQYSSDSKVPWQGRPAAWEFTYDTAGRVVHETAFDVRNAPLWAFVYSPPRADNPRVRTGYYIGPEGYAPRDREHSAVVDIRYSPEGFEESWTYRDRLGRPARGLDKAFGRRQVFDGDGRRVAITSLGADGNP